MDVASMTRKTRESAGLSIRALAAKSGVAASTISRIEAASMDPTVDMLSRVIEATGHTLELSATAPTPPSEMARRQPRLGDLVAAWQRTESRDQPEWTALRAFLDALTRGVPMPVTGVDGLRAVEIADACYESAESGRVVRLVR